MTTLAQIKAQYITAMKNKDELQKNLLRGILGEADTRLTAVAIDKRTPQFEVEKVMATINFFVNKNKENQEFFKNNPEKLMEIKAEMEILKQFLPKQMTEDEIKEALLQRFTPSEVDAKQVGKIIGEMKKEFGTQIDGSTLKKVADQVFAK